MVWHAADSIHGVPACFSRGADRRDARLSNTTHPSRARTLTTTLYQHWRSITRGRSSRVLWLPPHVPASPLVFATPMQTRRPPPPMLLLRPARGALSPPQAASLDKAHTTTLATAGLAVLE